MLPWSLLLYSALVVSMIGLVLVVSHLAGERTRARAAQEVFESGVLPVGDARMPVNAKFYLIAMFFVIFDLEAVFIYAWAVALPESGWLGFVEMAIFIGVLVAALVYLWRLGALDWVPQRARRRIVAGREAVTEPQPAMRQEQRDAVVVE